MPPFRRARSSRGAQLGWILLWALAGALAFNAGWLLVTHRGFGAGAGGGEGRRGHRRHVGFEAESVTTLGGALTDTGAAAVAGQAGRGGGGGGGSAAEADACHVEQEAEYDGEEVVKWGTGNLQPSAAACCDSCRSEPRCNVWVYCAAPGGCPGDRGSRECWLKRARALDPSRPRGRRAPGLGWTSGAIFSQKELDAAKERLEAQRRHLLQLRANESLPLVYLDVTIKGKPVGRIEAVLFTDISPRAAENMRQLCTGEAGIVPEGREGAGKPYWLKGRPFYRIIDQFIDQTGAETESVFGSRDMGGKAPGQFKDDPGGLKLKHDRKGLLSVANMGADTTTSHFSIMMGPAPHLNGNYVIFGQVVSGFDVMDAINVLSRGKKDNTATAADGVVISDAGQLRRGTIVPDLTLGL